MKKRIIFVLGIIMCMILSVGIFTACATKKDASQKYTISFYADEELVFTLKTAGNEEIGLPDAPQKEGFTFDGWYSDKGTWQNELTERTYADKPLTADVSAYAYYKKIEEPTPEPPQKYTVRFDTNDGTAVSDMTVSTIDKSPVTTKKGYTFVGWYTESAFTNKVPWRALTASYKARLVRTMFSWLPNPSKWALPMLVMMP